MISGIAYRVKFYQQIYPEILAQVFTNYFPTSLTNGATVNATDYMNFGFYFGTVAGGDATNVWFINSPTITHGTLGGSNAFYVVPNTYDSYGAALSASNSLAAQIAAVQAPTNFVDNTNLFISTIIFSDGTQQTTAGSGGSSLWTSSGGAVYPSGAIGGDTVWTNNGSTIYPL